MPRKELRSTYNTDCWEQEEACLAHPGTNTVGEGRREGSSQWAARSHGPLFSSLLTFPCLLSSLPLEEDTGVHRGTGREIHKDREKQI